MRLPQSLVRLSFLLAASALTPVVAATVTWDTSTATGYQSGSGNWGTDAFWSKNGTALAAWAAGDSAIFLGQSTLVTDTITIGAGQTIGGLSFGSATTSGNWTLSGAGTLSLAGDAAFAVASGSTATISAPLGLSTYVLNKTGAGTLRLNTPTLATPTILVSAGILELQKASVNFSGGTIRVASGAELALRSTDTWGASGTTTAATITLDGGTLSSNGFFNSLNNLTLNGGTINANGGVNASYGAFQFGGTLTVNRSASINQSGSNGNINLASTVMNVNVGAALTSNAVFQGASTLTKGGFGELVLTGASTYSGGTTLSAGGLQVGNNAALGTGAITFSGANGWLSSDGTTARTLANTLTFSNETLLGNGTKNGQLTFTGAVTISGVRTISMLSNVDFAGAVGGTGSLQKVGLGDLSLSGTNTLSGYLQVQSGKLTLNYATNNTAKFAGALNLQGGTLELSGGSFAQTATSTSLNGGVSLTRASGTATLALGAITRGAGGLLNVQSAGIATTTTANSNGLLAGVLLGGALAANDGSGNIVAYSGYADIASQGGVIANATASNVRLTDVGNTTGTVTVGTGVTTINSLVNSSLQAGTVTIGTGNTLRLGSVGTVIAGVGLGFTGGTLTAGGADNTAGELQFVVGSGTSTISSVIANNGTGVVSLTKSGDGVLVLSGASTNTGATYVQAGTLEVGGRAATSYRIESGATLKLGANYSGGSYSPSVYLMGAGVSATTGLLLKSGISYSINGLTLDNAATTIRNYGGTTAATLYGFDSNGNMMDVRSAASGSVIDALVKFDMGQYGYAVTVSAGAATANGDLTINSTLNGSGSGLGFFKRGSGSVKLTGNSNGLLTSRLNMQGGRLILAGGDNRVGAIDFAFANDGKLVLGDASATSAQSIGSISSSNAASAIVGGNAASSVLTFGLAADGSFLGKLGGDLQNENNLSVVKSGAGILTLSTASTFTGGTTLSAGGITLGNSQALGTGLVTISGGTLNLSTYALANTVVWNGGAITGTGSIGGLTATAGVVTVKLVGKGDITKTGTGVLEFQAANTATEGYTGNLSLGAGTVKFTGTGSLGAVASSVANYGGDIANAGILEFAGSATQSLGGVISGAGSFTLSGSGQVLLYGDNTYSGGTTVSAGTATAYSATAFGTGAVNISGTGTVDLGGQAVGNSIVLSGGTLQGGTLNINKVAGSTAGTISANLNGSGGFTKNGAGTLIFSGTNTYTGGTTVSAGTLLVHGMVGAVTVASGGTLGGYGYVGDTTVASGGTIAAGASVGLLTVGNLSLASGSAMTWQLHDASKSAGVGYDLVVASTLDLSGLSAANRATLNLMTLANASDNVSGTPLVFDKNVTQSFTLINYTSLNLGANTNVSNLFTINTSGFKAKDGTTLSASDFAVINDSANNALKITYYTPVPEPSTYGLVLGFLSLATMAVRRSRPKAVVRA